MKKVCRRLSVQNSLAQDCLIAGIFEDVNADFQELLKKGNINPKPLMVCSGGTSSRCTANNHWTLDLRKNYQQIDFELINKTVEVGAGITMGSLLKELEKHGRSFPTGLSNLPGIGYILTGGISPLSRSQGLAIDQILKINGVWGNGDSFKISKPTTSSSPKDQHIWRGLCGAAPFLGIVTKLTLQTQPKSALNIWQSFLQEKDLMEAIKQAESWPEFISLQWIWGDEIKILVVANDSTKKEKIIQKLQEKFPCSESLVASEVSGMQELPALTLPSLYTQNKSKMHSEVIGLLGPSWEGNYNQLIQVIAHLISNRPNEDCYIACQQLGGLTTRTSRISTSFIHRKSIWKLWINASWKAEGIAERKRSLIWLKEVWEALASYCPGIHLAQMHQHLPWHHKETEKAFEEWLPDLQNLKSKYDPQGILPRL